MATSESLLVERPTDEIVVFRINRPQVRNALNLEVRSGLADAVTHYGADKTVRCMIVTGSDLAFAAGADIAEMAEAAPVEVMSRNVQKYWRVIMECPKPLIAAVEGFALGGGWSSRCVLTSLSRAREQSSVCPKSGWAFYPAEEARKSLPVLSGAIAQCC